MLTGVVIIWCFQPKVQFRIRSRQVYVVVYRKFIFGLKFLNQFGFSISIDLKEKENKNKTIK